MLGLDEGGIDRLDYRGFVRDRTEIVIEYRLSDNVEGDGTEFFFHFDLPSGLALSFDDLVEGGDEGTVAIPEQTDHVLQPRLVKCGHDGSPPHGPRLGIGGDESLPHDGLQYLRQQTLVEFRILVPQYMLRLHRIANDQETLGAEAQLVRTAVFVVVPLQPDEHGPVCDVGNLALGQRAAVQRGISAVDLFDVRAEDVGRISEFAIGAGISALHHVEIPHQIPPPGEAVGVGVGVGVRIGGRIGGGGLDRLRLLLVLHGGGEHSSVRR
mmetsp:Transcript_17425/g.50762  ORF Transcript_17425/g.50762 Transcript_17425/m.50762 type:complete len:268 (-) Transcript_17425:219-1022(-)